MKTNRFIITALVLASFVLSPFIAKAQVEYRWLAVGSLQNFYSSIGSEIEEGLYNRQQAGLVWPGIYDFQDSQAAKGMWLGATNWTDENGNLFPVKVIHVGPRVRGTAFFFNEVFETVSKYPKPEVFVDGNLTEKVEQVVDRVDPTIKSDRYLHIKVNTAMGITIDKKVHQFSQEYHDNYHLIEITLTNTGNTDSNPTTIELPNQTVTGLFYHEQNRWSSVLQSRYTIGNASGWGKQTMNDRRGDGLGSTRPDDPNDPTENEFKAQFSWHGKLLGFAPPIPGATDNVGAPIIVPSTVNGYLSSADTTGRLGAYHFVGKVHVYADSSATQKVAAQNQPYTMDEIDSDNTFLTSGNDPFNATRMSIEYSRMSAGKTPRHAYLVEPTGFPGFINPTSDPSLGLSGGYSAATGYGPYTLAPGESVKIVFAEAVSGIGHKFATEVGAEYKKNIKNPPAGMTPARAAEIKNTKMFQGRDSLFQTFRRVIQNYNSNFNINQPPPPPLRFDVTSTGQGIELSWEYNDAEISKVSGFEVYRSAFRADSTARRIAVLDPDERFFVDGDRTPTDVGGPPSRGIDYFYYVTAVGKASDNADGNFNPTGELRSSRYYSQTYAPARLLRPPGEDLSEFRIVPNPYIAESNVGYNFDTSRERIAFFDVPGECTITIFTELGERVKTLKGNKSGDIFWDFYTDSRQRIVSGIYIAVLVNDVTGEKIVKKFVVIF